MGDYLLWGVFFMPKLESDKGLYVVWLPGSIFALSLFMQTCGATQQGSGGQPKSISRYRPLLHHLSLPLVVFSPPSMFKLNIFFSFHLSPQFSPVSSSRPAHEQRAKIAAVYFVVIHSIMIHTRPAAARIASDKSSQARGLNVDDAQMTIFGF